MDIEDRFLLLVRCGYNRSTSSITKKDARPSVLIVRDSREFLSTNDKNIFLHTALYECLSNCKHIDKARTRSGNIERRGIFYTEIRADDRCSRRHTEVIRRDRRTYDHIYLFALHTCTFECHFCRFSPHITRFFIFCRDMTLFDACSFGYPLIGSIDHFRKIFVRQYILGYIGTYRSKSGIWHRLSFVL